VKCFHDTMQKDSPGSVDLSDVQENAEIRRVSDP